MSRRNPRSYSKINKKSFTCFALPKDSSSSVVMNKPDAIKPAGGILEESKDTISSSPDLEHSRNDVEKQIVSPLPDLKRKLKSRHLQMIAIGKLDFCSHFYSRVFVTYNGKLQVVLSVQVYSSVVVVQLRNLDQLEPLLPISSWGRSYILSCCR